MYLLNLEVEMIYHSYINVVLLMLLSKDEGISHIIFGNLWETKVT